MNINHKILLILNLISFIFNAFSTIQSDSKNYRLLDHQIDANLFSTFQVDQKMDFCHLNCFSTFTVHENLLKPFAGFILHLFKQKQPNNHNINYFSSQK